MAQEQDHAPQDKTEQQLIHEINEQIIAESKARTEALLAKHRENAWKNNIFSDYEKLQRGVPLEQIINPTD